MSTGYQHLAADTDDGLWQPPAEDTLQQEVEDIYAQLSHTQGEREERHDLRDVATYTIDPGDAKDFDDAISVEKEYDDGRLSGYRAWVHIADVPYYIDEGSAIDTVTQQQAFTEYIPEPVTHMLPADLSQKFSLTAGRNRLTNTFELEFDADGALESYDIYRSIINTDRNLSYEQANEYVSTPGSSPTLGKREREVVRDLEELSFLTQRLTSRADREYRDRTTAYRVVEELMLTANELGAEELRERDAGIYRVHEGSGAGAEYAPYDDRHAGLDTEPYAHFTSPIRRYSDVVNWRIYWDEFSGDNDDIAAIADYLNDREAIIEHPESSFDSRDVTGIDH